jgi:hypothetical protein
MAMSNRDGIISRMAAGKGDRLRTATASLLVLAASIANAANVGSLPAPPKPAAALAATSSILHLDNSAIVALAAPDYDATLSSALTVRALSAKPPARRRVALEVTNLPARGILKTARLQVPMQSYVPQFTAPPALAISFIAPANRQRAP